VTRRHGTAKTQTPKAKSQKKPEQDEQNDKVSGSGFLICLAFGNLAFVICRAARLDVRAAMSD